jgi:hypothetical protein
VTPHRIVPAGLGIDVPEETARETDYLLIDSKKFDKREFSTFRAITKLTF